MVNLYFFSHRINFYSDLVKILKILLLVPLLQIFDKLCQSFGGDVLQTLFNTAEGLANSTPENIRFCIWRFISDQALAVAASNILSLD